MHTEPQAVACCAQPRSSEAAGSQSLAYQLYCGQQLSKSLPACSRADRRILSNNEFVPQAYAGCWRPQEALTIQLPSG